MGDGSFITGYFRNKMSLSDFAWDQRVKSCLAELCKLGKDAKLVERYQFTVKIHEFKLLDFYDDIGGSDAYKVNRSTCVAL